MSSRTAAWEGSGPFTSAVEEMKREGLRELLWRGAAVRTRGAAFEVKLRLGTEVRKA